MENNGAIFQIRSSLGACYSQQQRTTHPARYTSELAARCARVLVSQLMPWQREGLRGLFLSDPWFHSLAPASESKLELCVRVGPMLGQGRHVVWSVN